MAKKSAKKQAKQKRQQQQQRARQQARSHAPSRLGQDSSDDDQPSEKATTKPAANTQVRNATAKLDQISLSNEASQLNVKLSPSPSGLGNMGNTCYFNSVMQVLGQTYILHELLTERLKADFGWNAKTYYLNEKPSGKKYFASEQLNLKLAEAPPLESTFTKLQQEIFQAKRTNPIDLLREIRKERSQFEGWSQQDSQELLISLLDSLKKAEMRRQSNALIQGLNIANPKNATDEEKARANRFRITARHTVLDAIFGGQLLSFIHCTVCNYRSFTFEQFMDLSLSLNLHPNNIPTQDMSNTNVKNKFNKNAANSAATKGGKKGAKKQQQSSKDDVSGEEAEEEEDNGPADDDANADSNRNMTAKERKQRRVQKKAARREARKNARDQAVKDQDRTVEHWKDCSEDENDDEDKSNDSQELKPIDNQSEVKDSESIELESKDLKDDFIKLEDSKILKKENDDDDDDSPVKTHRNTSNSETESCKSDDQKDDIPELEVVFKDDEDVEEKPIFYGPQLPPMFQVQHKLSDSDSGCGEEDDEDEGIDMTESRSSIPRVINSSNNDDSKTPTATGDSDSGQDATSITTIKKEEGETRSQDQSASGSEAEDASTAIIASTSDESSNSSSDSSILSHITPEFRSKFYDLAMQKLAYSSQSSSQFDNHDLGTLFESFIKPEILDGANKYLCESCCKANGGTKTYSKAVRCQLIALPPPVLVIHLKRFEASGFGGRGRGFASMHKLNTSISFPERLNLSPYTSKIYESFAKFYEPDYDSEDEENKLEYRLYGVVIHSGGLRAGHYMAYVCVRPGEFYKDRLNRFLHLKPFVSNIEHILSVCYEKETQNGVEHASSDPEPTSNTTAPTKPDCSSDSSNRKWFFISDSSVSTTTLENVLRDMTSPYLLFYERTC